MRTLYASGCFRILRSLGKDGGEMGCSVTRRGVRTDSSPLPLPPSLDRLESAQDTAHARHWLMRFKSHKIPKDSVEITFSRSSGPGGQNVNKVNTKATLRCPLDSEWIPRWARAGLCKSPYFVSSSRSILIKSMAHRSQAQNIDDCLSKLHSLISSISSVDMRNEPSEKQKERVRSFERAERAKRRQEKDRRSQVKRDRSSSRKDWD